MLWPKKNSYKEFDNEKKFLRLENSPPPSHKFSNGPSLRIPDFRSYISTIAACFYLAAAEGPDKVFREKLAEEQHEDHVGNLSESAPSS